MATHSPVRGRAPELIGRRSERDVLDRCIEAVRAGESRALVVRGEPGVGKTALLDYLVARDNIRVNSVHPGPVRTPMVAGSDAAALAAAAVRGLAIPRMAEPDEITRLVLFVASDEASFSTGSEFIADGGHLLGPVPQHERAEAAVA